MQIPIGSHLYYVSLRVYNDIQCIMTSSFRRNIL